MPGELFTLREAAQWLKVSERTVLRLIAAGKLRGRKVGRQWRFDETELRRYYDSLAVETPGQPPAA